MKRMGMNMHVGIGDNKNLKQKLYLFLQEKTFKIG